jgi:hypothetical protein
VACTRARQQQHKRSRHWAIHSESSKGLSQGCQGSWRLVRASSAGVFDNVDSSSTGEAGTGQFTVSGKRRCLGASGVVVVGACEFGRCVATMWPAAAQEKQALGNSQ